VARRKHDAGPDFDLIVAVDWSAASVPVTGADSIWVATSDGCLHNPPTRAAAAVLLDAIVDSAAGRRVLVALDVAFGYPAGSASLFGLDGDGWRAMWSFLAATVADDRNRNDRFAVGAALNGRSGLPAGPFWGRPWRSAGGAAGAHDVLEGLAPTRPPFDVIAEWRACERELRARRLRPSSVWQLCYAGSVGGQALTAIPVLERLRLRCERVEVWPFTTGFADPDELAADAVVLAELWPSAFAVDRARHSVKDAAQVLHVVDELVAADHAGVLAGWFGAPGITAADRRAALDEEAWILVPPGHAVT
jgi:precorrin-8X/cobalt-precorrin-8 methylmutase